MSRRLLAAVALLVVSYALSACTSPTAPKADCAQIGGTGTCSR